MRNLKIPAVLAVLAAIIVASASQASPPFMNYQAMLYDINNNPVDGERTITFSIWNVESGGNPMANQLWEEIRTLTVQNGRLHVLLGQDTPLTSNIFAESDRWLQIEVDPDPPMTPRTPIASVPYSLLAGDVPDGTISHGKLQDDAVGPNKIQNGAVGHDKLEDNAVGAGKLQNGAVGHDKLEDNAVGAGKLQNGAVGHDKLEDNAVGAGKLQNGAVGHDKLEDNAVGSGKIQNGAITGQKIDKNGALDGQVMKWSDGQNKWAIGNDLTGGWVDAGATIRLETITDNVGIGVAVPGEKLDVDGNIRASGTISCGNSITIDGGGTPDRITASSGTIDFDDENLVTTGKATIGPAHINTGLYAFAVGNSNESTGNFSSVGGGSHNKAAGHYSVVGGGGGGDWGDGNVADGSYCVVSGGRTNHAHADGSTIAGGDDNTAISRYTTVSGGQNNIAGVTDEFQESWSTVGGGQENYAKGANATIPSGIDNSAIGNHSFAAGALAKANHNGSIVIAAVQGTGLGNVHPADSVQSSALGQMVLRADGWFYLTDQSGLPPTSSHKFLNTSTGGFLSTSGTWENYSDRNMKENFRTIDGDEILEKLEALPVTRWNYKKDGSATTHIGPVAQDFYALFGVGSNDKSISTIDPAGIALAAIQELYSRNIEQQQQIKELEAQLAEIQAQLQGLLTERQ